MKQTLQKAIDAIAADILALTQSAIELQEGNKTKGGLQITSAAVATHIGDPTVIELLLHNHAGAKGKAQLPPPSVSSLRDWALSNNIPPDNEMLHTVSQAIARDGEQANPMLAVIEKQVERNFERQWGDRLLEAIGEEVDLLFN